LKIVGHSFAAINIYTMPRRLVTVRRVATVYRIPGADRIEVAQVDGWTCVTSIDQLAVGDLAIYFEVDSFLPAGDDRWAFLSRKFIRWNGMLGFRVQTIKIRGQISQGLLFRLAEFSEIVAVHDKLTAEHGREIADEKIATLSFDDSLKVQKYERLDVTTTSAPLVQTPGEQLFLGPRPNFIPRTEQERVQNLPEVLDKWKDELFQETTKMDGTSMTIYFVRKDSDHFPRLPRLIETDSISTRSGDQPNGRFGLCARNKDLVERDVRDSKIKGCNKVVNFWEVAKRYDLPAKLNALNRSFALQGELCGSSIQANFEGFPEGFHDFYLYSVYDIDAQTYLPPKEVEQWAAKLEIKHVPVHGYQKLCEIGSTVSELLERAEGKGVNGKKREGIVLKHVDGQFSFKVISNSYLLKHGE
jgi:RNA ligase (TIGR02306 family)